MRAIRMACAAMLALGAVLAAGSASATPIDFSFNFSGNGVQASGVLDTDGVLVDGHFGVTGISGTRNGVAITGLVEPGGTDNRLYVPGDLTDEALGFLLDNVGIYYAVGGVTRQLFEGIGPPQGLPTGVIDLNVVTGREFDVSLNVTPLVSIPEPASAALLAAGLLAAALLRLSPRWSRRQR